MTKEEYWKCFLSALRMDRQLIEELTRISMTDVETEPEDWTTYFDVHTVAEKMDVEIDSIYELIENDALSAKEVQSGVYMVPLIAVKEFMLYDKSRLLEVPWEEVTGERPHVIEQLFETDLIGCSALTAEALYLKGEVDDFKRQSDKREDVETDQ